MAFPGTWYAEKARSDRLRQCVFLGRTATGDLELGLLNVATRNDMLKEMLLL